MCTHFKIKIYPSAFQCCRKILHDPDQKNRYFGSCQKNLQNLLLQNSNSHQRQTGKMQDTTT